MTFVLTLLTVVFSAAFAVPLGTLLSLAFGWSTFWLGPGIAFAGMFLVGNAVVAGMAAVLSLSGAGLWSLSPVRYVKGKIAWLILAVPPFFAFVACTAWLQWGPLMFVLGVLIQAIRDPLGFLLPSVEPSPGEAGPDLWDRLFAGWLNACALLAVLAALDAIVRLEKPVVAYVTRPFRQLWRALKTGLGGSAAFDGLLDEWGMPWKRGQVILGVSMYEPRQRLGVTDDRHLLTIATTRSGKGRSCIIPNLLTYPGSVLCIDPKAENAAITAVARRDRLGQSIHILDPFGVLAGLGLDPHTYPVQRFNPLAAIELDEIDVVEQIGNLAAALIVKSEHSNPFWDDSAQAILVGIIAHVLVWPKLKPEQRTLATVRDYVSGTNGRSVADMAGHPGVANLTAIGVAEMKRSPPETIGGILVTLGTHMKWLDSIAMRQAMAASDFDLASLKHRKATLYLVIPVEYIDQHARFLRLFITLALRAAGRGAGAKHPMLFIMDEFAQLGALKVIENAAAIQAGAGVRLWPIIQNITQLRPYGDNWEVFLANAAQTQVFAVNDQATARYFSEKLGHHMAWRKVRAGSGHEWVPQGATWFRTSAELSRESSRDSGRALIFYEGGRQALMRRGAYDQMFEATEYAPNPYRRQKRTERQWNRFKDVLETFKAARADAFDQFVSDFDEWITGRSKKRPKLSTLWTVEPEPEPFVASSVPTADVTLNVLEREVEASHSEPHAHVPANPRLADGSALSNGEKAPVGPEQAAELERMMAMLEALVGGQDGVDEGAETAIVVAPPPVAAAAEKADVGAPPAPKPKTAAARKPRTVKPKAKAPRAGPPAANGDAAPDAAQGRTFELDALLQGQAPVEPPEPDTPAPKPPRKRPPRKPATPAL